MTISTRQSDVTLLCRSKHSLAVQPIAGRTFIRSGYEDMLWSNYPENKHGSG